MTLDACRYNVPNTAHWCTTHFGWRSEHAAIHEPGCTTAPHTGECAPELDRLSDPHDCEPNDDGTACRTCGLPAERDDITPAELVALVAALDPDAITAARIAAADRTARLNAMHTGTYRAGE